MCTETTPNVTPQLATGLAPTFCRLRHTQPLPSVFQLLRKFSPAVYLEVQVPGGGASDGHVSEFANEAFGGSSGSTAGAERDARQPAHARCDRFLLRVLFEPLPGDGHGAEGATGGEEDADAEERGEEAQAPKPQPPLAARMRELVLPAWTSGLLDADLDPACGASFRLIGVPEEVGSVRCFESGVFRSLGVGEAGEAFCGADCGQEGAAAEALARFREVVLTHAGLAAAGGEARAEPRRSYCGGLGAVVI